MNHPRTRSLTACVACAAGLLLPAARAPAQRLVADPYGRILVTAPSRYWGYTYVPYVENPLWAAADAVRAGGEYLRAEGDYMVKKMEAASLREDVRQKKLDTRRKELEHWAWEREFRHNEFQKEIARVRARQVEEYRQTPSPAEILGAGPLNVLYDYLQTREPPAAGSTKVEQEWLEHIHLSFGGRGNLGVVKSNRIEWPRLMFRPSFADDRDKIEQLLDRAKKLAMAKNRNQEELAKTLADLESAVRVCQARLDREIRAGVDDPDCNPRHQIEGMKFLRQITDATFLLEKPNASYYMTAPQGKTVGELVAYMKEKGLRFAPATVGCEPYYTGLHRALADEVTRLKNLETPSLNR